MNSILSQVTPLTKGLLWLTNGPMTPENPFFRDVDYLLNGLLTATLKSSEATDGHVLISENFGQTFYVYVGPVSGEKHIRSFFDLIAPQIKQENNLVLIDDVDAYENLTKMAPADIKNKIQLAK